MSSETQNTTASSWQFISYNFLFLTISDLLDLYVVDHGEILETGRDVPVRRRLLHPITWIMLINVNYLIKIIKNLIHFY